MEKDLIAVYNTGQTELAALTNKVTETMGVAKANNAAQDELIKNAITGRYEGSQKPGTGGTSFSAIAEAYPDVAKNTELFANVQRVVTTGRDQFKDRQNEMQSRIARFETWKDSGLFKSWAVKQIGFPRDEMVIKVGGTSYRGQDALDKMTEVIGSSESIKAYESGVSDPLL